MPSIPVELLDRIFSFIDDRRDLLSPSLASKLFAMIVQSHLQYRVIHCTLCTTDLWDQLSQNFSLAQNVRSVHIMRQYDQDTNIAPPPIVPKQFVEHAYHRENRKFYSSLPLGDLPQVRKVEVSLVRAIKNMRNLKSFTWDRCPPLLDSIVDVDVHEDIWTALRTGCPDLEHLYITDASESDEAHVRHIHDSAIWALPQDLKSFKYLTYAYRDMGQQVPMEGLASMLHRCPSLEELSLIFVLHGWQSDAGEAISSADLNGLIADMGWPNLHALDIAAGHLSPSTAATFFMSHPTITSLRVIETTARFIKDEAFDINVDIHSIPEPFLTLLPGTLPNLTRVDVPPYIFHAIQLAQGPSSGLHTGSRGNLGNIAWAAPAGSISASEEP